MDFGVCNITNFDNFHFRFNRFVKLSALIVTFEPSLQFKSLLASPLERNIEIIPQESVTTPTPPAVF